MTPRTALNKARRETYLRKQGSGWIVGQWDNDRLAWSESGEVDWSAAVLARAVENRTRAGVFLGLSAEAAYSEAVNSRDEADWTDQMSRVYGHHTVADRQMFDDLGRCLEAADARWSDNVDRRNPDIRDAVLEAALDLFANDWGGDFGIEGRLSDLATERWGAPHDTNDGRGWAIWRPTQHPGRIAGWWFTREAADAYLQKLRAADPSGGHRIIPHDSEDL